MNIRFFLFSLLMFSANIVFSQNVIVGKVCDAANRQAVDFVNIAVIREGETTPITGTSTDASGKFEIQGLENGTYLCTFSFVGYLEQAKKVVLSGKKISLGTIYLAEESKQLSEIEVVGQGSTMRFELDKKVFSVDQNIASAGGSASEVLQNIPSVDVDNEGNISLRNTENVEIWINGKPAGLTADNRAQVLQQLPAESIQEIEIITNPSAKYNPEGTAGIINLVMKKNRKPGYYGSVTAGVMYPWGGILGYQAGVNINYSQGRVDAYLNVGYRRMSMNGSAMSDRYNYQGTDTTRLYQTGGNDRSFGGIFTRAGIDIRLSDKSTLGLSGFGMFLNRSRESSSIHYILTDEVPDVELRNYERVETATGGRPGYNLILDYRVDFTKSQNLTVSAAYSNFKRHNSSVYVQNNLANKVLVLENSQQQISNNDNDMLEFKADYTNKFTQNSRLEAGWQSTFQNRNSLADATDLVTGAEIAAYYNKFDYKEQIHAAYLTYGNRFWDKLSVQVGLRTEYMLRHTTTNDVPNESKSYFQLFPSAYVSYAMPKGNELQLNYTRRVDRPRGRQINPFRDFSDSTSISYGNGDLLPQFSSSLELNYLKNWEKHTLSAGVFYRFADGAISRISYMDGDVMESTYINISKQQDVGIEVVGKNRLFDNFLQLTTSVNGYYNAISGAEYTTDSGIKVTIDGQSTLAWSARISAMMMFMKTFSGQLTARYSSPRLVAQGIRTQSYAIDLGLRKSFFNKQLSLNLMVRDLLNSHNHRTISWSDDFYQISERMWSSRTLGLTVSYNFGNMKPQKRENRNSQNISSEYEDDMGSE